MTMINYSKEDFDTVVHEHNSVKYGEKKEDQLKLINEVLEKRIKLLRNFPKDRQIKKEHLKIDVYEETEISNLRDDVIEELKRSNYTVRKKTVTRSPFASPEFASAAKTASENFAGIFSKIHLSSIPFETIREKVKTTREIEQENNTSKNDVTHYVIVISDAVHF